MTQPICLLGAFARHLESRPDALLYRYLLQGNPGGEVAAWTYAETYARSAAVAELVSDHGFAGKRVLLLSHPGLDYVATFLGCLMARVVIVPSYPPPASRIESTVPRLAAIARAAQIDGIFTTRGIADEARSLLVGTPLHDVPWLCTDVLAVPAPRHDWLSIPDGDALAYLQFTSGSTSAPKGVMVTHGNVAHNSALIQRKFRHTSDLRVMSWLPPYHDMGLVGGIIQPLYAGGEATLMSPADFLRRPSRWIEAISRFRVTTTGGPDVAYALCARHFRPGSECIDLSSWQTAFNGAESIRGETLDRFCETFGPYGFERRAFYPCYGLAEATLLVTGGERDEPPVVQRADREQLAQGRFVAAAAGAPALELVSCGTAAADQQLLIVDPHRRTRVAAGGVGEIWVAGASVTAGYWNQPEATHRSFAARLADEPTAGPFARTGDLGFLADGQLYITGRHQDLLIVRGRHIYPQDVEDTVAAAHPAVRAGCVAAFSTSEATGEGIAIAAEVRMAARQDATAVIEAIRRAVAATHDVGATEVFLLPGRATPKTSSGKLQRAGCRAGIANGSIAVIAHSRADHASSVEPIEQASPAA